MAHDIIGSVAEQILAAHVDGRPIDPVRDSLAHGGIGDAYDVQRLNTARWIADGRRLVGRKIGLTSVAVQRQLGVDEPDYGALFADMSLVDGEPIPAGRVLQPRVEAEVAIVLGADLPHEDTTLVDLIRSIDYLLPAIEVVGSRIRDWDINILDTVADNASSGMYVLGTRPTRPADVELADVAMSMLVDDETVSTGTGSACLGHPYVAALWLARRMAQLGEPLVAGDLLMTGALGAMVPIVPGARVSATIDGLGAVRTELQRGAG